MKCIPESDLHTEECIKGTNRCNGFRCSTCGVILSADLQGNTNPTMCHSCADSYAGRVYAEIDLKAGKWFGNSTSAASCFFYHGEGASDFHRTQWEAVVNELKRLTIVRDKNGDFVVQLVYHREDKNFVIAYRFTSDWAYRQYESKLVHIGGSLGRGAFDPFSESGKYEMDTLVLQKDDDEHLPYRSNDIEPTSTDREFGGRQGSI